MGHISPEASEGGAIAVVRDGVLYLYGNYTGDIMNFDMAAELCDGVRRIQFILFAPPGLPGVNNIC